MRKETKVKEARNGFGCVIVLLYAQVYSISGNTLQIETQRNIYIIIYRF